MAASGEGGSGLSATPPGAVGGDVMAGLLCRFVVNLPASELSDWMRVFYHLEKMWWFYLDFYSNVGEKSLVLLAHHRPNFQRFVSEALATVHVRPREPLDDLISRYYAYKNSIPVAGCAIINSSKNPPEALVIKPMACESWAFPKGKQNFGESIECTAIRETAEECGLEPTAEQLRLSVLIHPTATSSIYLVQLDDKTISLATDRAAKRHQGANPSRCEVERVKWIPLCNPPPVSLTWLARRIWSFLAPARPTPPEPPP